MPPVPVPVTDAELAYRVRVGATLRMARELRGWSLTSLSAELDISYSYLSNIEAGRKPLTNQLLARAAVALKVDQVAITHPRPENGTPAEILAALGHLASLQSVPA